MSTPDEYLTVTEVAERLKLKPRTVKNKMATGVFKMGVHYFSPAGLGPRFKWSAIVAWLEGSETSQAPQDWPFEIQMSKGYLLRDNGRQS